MGAPDQGQRRDRGLNATGPQFARRLVAGTPAVGDYLRVPRAGGGTPMG